MTNTEPPAPPKTLTQLRAELEAAKTERRGALNTMNFYFHHARVVRIWREIEQAEREQGAGR